MTEKGVKNMKKAKKTVSFFIAIIAIGIIIVSVTINVNHKEKWKYYDDVPVKSSVTVAHSKPSLSKEQHESSAFYVKLDKKQVDEGIFYHPKQKRTDNGFLVKRDEKGTFQPID